MKLKVPKLEPRKWRQTFKTWFLCYHWGCEPEPDGPWWMGNGGRIILLKPQPCARCGRTMGVDEDGKA